MLHSRTVEFWIDVGGTFTDCFARFPDGSLRRHKLLSASRYQSNWEPGTSCLVGPDPSTPKDFFRGFTARCPGWSKNIAVNGYDPQSGEINFNETPPTTADEQIFLYSPDPAPLTGIRFLLGLAGDASIPNCQVKLGTTRGTNALLERQGAAVALVTTAGLEDAVAIGDQSRADLFALAIQKATPLYEQVLSCLGRIAANGEILAPVDIDSARAQLQQARQAGCTAVAICLLHGHRAPQLENTWEWLAREAGFDTVSVASSMAPVRRLVPRSETTLVDAYLAPVLKDYIDEISAGLAASHLQLMCSHGALKQPATFAGHDSVLSGPAGGVVGIASLAQEHQLDAVIGFDMGGTSTDVSRFDGRYETRDELLVTSKDGSTQVRILAPMLHIETVAAGGGSRCWFDGVRLRVGPRSAGSDPGPACYGRGGPLTITDCNLFLGRIQADRFAFPLDLTAAKQRLQAVVDELKAAGQPTPSLERIAAGFLELAAATMADPIKQVSLARGFAPAQHTLVSFGGAGAQHACEVAQELGMTHILVPLHGSILSAYGIGQAPIKVSAERELWQPLSNDLLDHLQSAAAELRQLAESTLAKEQPASTGSRHDTLHWTMQFAGQDSSLVISGPADPQTLAQLFRQEHHSTFGFDHPDRDIVLRAMRYEIVVDDRKPSPDQDQPPGNLKKRSDKIEATKTTRWWSGQQWQTIPLHDWQSLCSEPGHQVDGPALIAGFDTAVVLLPGWRATIQSSGDLMLNNLSVHSARAAATTQLDAIEVSLISRRVSAIAEQMGEVLRKTALSVNIKERLDFSCAVFDAAGRLIVNAPHIPVHLGAMQETVQCLTRAFATELQAGDLLITNDPFQGGSHLPDVTAVMPIFLDHNINSKESAQPAFFVGARAHHAEIGGAQPGSMPAHSSSLAEEGIVIPPTRIPENSASGWTDLAQLLAAGPMPSRAPADNIADLQAQGAACRRGATLIKELVASVGHAHLAQACDRLRTDTALATGQALDDRLGHLPLGAAAKDQLDDGQTIALTIKREAQRWVFDFAGTSPVHPGNFNANVAITKAAILYCLRCLLQRDIPLNSGVLEAIDIKVPPQSLLNPPPLRGEKAEDRPAVVGGNVETSQRIVDVVLQALNSAAASQGTMNNLLFGRSGDSAFGYYETIAGGSGAGPDFVGAWGVQTHMTNTRMTDPEVMEDRYPVRVQRFSRRRGSGGAGAQVGGDGLVRELEFLEPVTVSWLSQRRRSGPPGLAGGQAGEAGLNEWWDAHTQQWQALSASGGRAAKAGDRIRISTPGGGGWGPAES